MAGTMWPLARRIMWAWPLVAPAWAAGVITYGDPGRNGPPSPQSLAYGPWQLTGQFGAFVGTPIAANYFLTANHVGGNSSVRFSFQGVSYTVDGSFGTDGRAVIPDTDLAVWKVKGEFPTYAPLYTSSDEVNQHVVVIGRGTPRGEQVLVNGRLKGWLWATRDAVQSWGENDASAIDDFAGQIGEALSLGFNAGKGPNECALSTGDSGGGVFIEEDGVWKLAGVNYAVSGPYSRAAAGSSPFMASLFDTSGLYVDRGDGIWIAAHGPSLGYASRISSRASLIYRVAPGCPVVQQDYTVDGTANMGNVDVAGVTVVGNGTDTALLLANYIRGGELEIRSGGRVIMNRNGTESGTSRVSRLAIDSGGQLDLSDNELIVQADGITRQTVLEQVTAFVAAGRNSGARLWEGNGIASGVAAENALTGLAVMLNDRGEGTAVYSQFGGQAVDINSILVQYTWNGDMNLDGVVNADDYFLIDSGFIRQAGGYRNGDLSYDGVVNADDYFLIDSAFLGQTGPLCVNSGEGHRGAVGVPEPGAMGVLLLGAGGLLAGRRRGKGA